METKTAPRAILAMQNWGRATVDKIARGTMNSLNFLLSQMETTKI